MHAGREAAAEGTEAVALGALAGRLTAAREGLRPVGADVLQTAAARLADDEVSAGAASGRTDGAVPGLESGIVGGENRTAITCHAACSATQWRSTSAILWMYTVPCSPWADSGSTSLVAGSVTKGEGAGVIEGLTPAESAALTRRTAALAFAPQALAAAEQRVSSGMHEDQLHSVHMSCCKGISAGQGLVCSPAVHVRLVLHVSRRLSTNQRNCSSCMGHVEL